MLLRRRKLIEKEDNTPILLHQYNYNSGPVTIGDYTGFEDVVGNYDLKTGNGESTYYKGDTSDTDQARENWGLYPGDSFTIIFDGVFKTTRYSQAQGFRINLSGAKNQNALSLGRGSTSRIYAIWQDNVNSNAAIPLDVSYYLSDGVTAVKNRSELTCLASNGNPQTIILYYNGSTGNVKTTVDNVVFNEFTHESPSTVHIDGIAMLAANITSNYWGFNSIKVYKGILE